MSSKENQELNELMSSCPSQPVSPKKAFRNAVNKYGSDGDVAEEGGIDKKSQIGGFVQWTSSDSKRYLPASRTAPVLVPGVYEIMSSPSVGIYYERIPVLTKGLLRFPQTNSNKVVTEIQTFWEREDLFREYKLAYKRGIILWGPPGSGKSCTIQLIMEDVVGRGGVVFKFTAPALFIEGVRIFREIQLDTPLVVLMEDIDSILDCYNESEVLNILDGVDQCEKAVFLATTNYPERLGSRIVNRPSRFDKRFKIGHPNPESRKMYLEHIIGGRERARELRIDLEKWVQDTDGFSIAHIKELFVAVIILGDEYDDAVETLGGMKEDISSDDDRDRMMGFTGASGKKGKAKTLDPFRNG